HTRSRRDWSSDVCSSDLILAVSVLFAALLLFIASAGVIHKAARESCAETMHYTGLEHKRRKKGKNREKKAPVRRYRRRSAGMERSEERRVGKERRCGRRR